MLDYFCIFTKGGALLWAMSFTALKGDPVNTLIRACLLEERTGESSFAYTSPSGGAYTLKWTLNNVRTGAGAGAGAGGAEWAPAFEPRAPSRALLRPPGCLVGPQGPRVVCRGVASQ